MASGSWFMGLWIFCKSYPEIPLSLSCFFFIRYFSRKDQIMPNWPIIGMLPSLLLNVHHLHDWLTDVLTQSGGTFVFHGPWCARMDLVITCDPANVNHVFTTNFSNFPKGPEFLEIFDILGDGIFNSDSSSWKIQRKLAHTHMNHKRFRLFVAKSCRQKVELGLIPVLEHIVRKEEIVDLQDVLQRFMFDSTCNLVFGVDPGCLSVSFPTVPFAKAMDDAEEVLLFRHVVPENWWKLLRWLGIGKEKRMADAQKIIDHFIGKYISMRREELKYSRWREGEDEATDLLTSYMDNEDEMSTAKSDKLLRDTTFNFMLAGRDTTSAALSWFFWLISKYPSVESRILEEMKKKLPGNEDGCLEKPKVFDTEELSTLVYLHAALCESLRLYPPVPFEHKGVLQPQVLPSGEIVRPSMKILFSLYSMGRMESIWGKDCSEFKPERWISDKGRIRFEPSYKFLSFNAGPRTCLGKDMAFAQMKSVVAALLYNYHVEVIRSHPVSPKIAIILHMKVGLMIRLSKRHH